MPPPHLRTGGGEARVPELAAELGLTSKEMLYDLKGMGAYVNSASSTVEPAVARKLPWCTGPEVRRSPAGRTSLRTSRPACGAEA